MSKLTLSPNVSSIIGTANQITASNPTGDVTLSIATGYVGQSSITTLGTISTGTWQGATLGSTYGGTGINNGSNTITINTNPAIFTFSGAYTLTVPATGTVALLGTSQTFTAAQIITSASTANFVPLTINQNDTTNNPIALSVSNTGSGVTLDLPSVNIAISSTTANLRIFTTNTATVDMGGSIVLGGYYNGLTSQTGFGGIAGRKENTTANNTRGYLQFLTNGTEAGRFDSNQKLNLKKVINQYNNISTVSNGIPSEFATIDSTGLTANVAAATLYSVPSTGAGMYRISAYVVETTAGSVSSTLPNVQIVYTDNDTGGSITIDATPILGVAGIGQTGALTANTVGTTSAGVIVVYAKASTTIQYQTVNYASTAGGMAYSLRIKIEAL